MTDLSALLTAIEHLDEPGEQHTLAGLHATWDSGDVDPLDTLLGRDSGGTLVAYAHNQNHPDQVGPPRAYLMGGVHPGWRRQGIGRAILEWQVAHARQWHAVSAEAAGPLHVYAWADERLVDRTALFGGASMSPMRWFADLSLDLATHVPTPPAVPDVTLAPYHPTLSEQVRAAHNEAFADHWAAQPVPRDRWEEQLGAQTSRPGWSWVALERATNQVVGYALNSADVDDWDQQGFAEGWTDRLGVRPGWRGRGVAQALLCASAICFAREGLDAAGIGVDSAKPDDAFRLYRRLGYDVGEVAVMYGRIETPESAQA
ncbi:MAG: GNAT family N-acetyltransferase [Propionibacteriaceae bacterium]